MKYLSLLIIFMIVSLVGWNVFNSANLIYSKETQLTYPFAKQYNGLKYRFYNATDKFIAYQIDSLLKTP